MDIKEFAPFYVYETYENLFETKLRPNVVKTKNVTIEGLITLISKGNIIWSNSIYDKKHIYTEGVIRWSKNKILIYFEKIENELTYKICILTDDLPKIDILIVGLNKFFTIDNI